LRTRANGASEGWVGSCRREILNHVIALNEQHPRRLIRDYVSYYHQDRIHDSLDKDTPDRRQSRTETFSERDCDFDSTS
jgi:transposase InsO family protein